MYTFNDNKMSIFKHRVATVCLKIHKIQNAIYYRAEYNYEQ